MEELKNEELLNIVGGASLTSAMISAVTKAVSTLFNLGQSVGSSLRRVITKKLC